jgi:thiol-disulfide isomerase/thioredoxin
MRQAIRWFGALLLATSSVQAADEREVRGRVVDEHAKPVASADVARFWSANGTHKGPGGRKLDLTNKDDLALFWGNLGRMEPIGGNAVKTDADGRFTLKLSWRDHHLVAFDQERQRVGLGVFPAGREAGPLEIKLAPAIRVRGIIRGPEKGARPEWTHVYACREDDPDWPLDSPRLVSCGSVEARFEMLLPPGSYVLDAYIDPMTSRVIPQPTITLTADRPEVDLGTLTLTPTPPSIRERVEKDRSEGKMGDYTKHYGRRPPRLFATEGRGVSKDAQPWDFPGKWVVVDFWGLGCAPCLGKTMPELIKFYEDHADKRDKFEILSVFIDTEGEVKSLAEVDKKLEPIVKKVWGGKTIPFPLLFDPSIQTWESYDLPGLGTMLLIDPQGNLVKGDLATLEEKLK